MNLFSRSLILTLCITQNIFLACCTTTPENKTPTLSVQEYISPSKPINTIRVGDAIEVRVEKQDSLSGVVTVSPDGVLSLPLVGDISVIGFTLPELNRTITEKLTNLIVSPAVTVRFSKREPILVGVLGGISKQGTYSLELGSGVLLAIAQAGGLTEFANPEKIYVLRSKPELTRIQFNYKTLVSGDPKAISFMLESGDIIFIDEN